MLENMFDLAVYPESVSPIPEQSIALSADIGRGFNIGGTAVQNPFRDYALGYLGYEHPILGDLTGLLGAGYSSDGRGLMGILGADYPIGDDWALSYRHYSSPNYSDDGSDFLGLRYSF